MTGQIQSQRLFFIRKKFTFVPFNQLFSLYRSLIDRWLFETKHIVLPRGQGTCFLICALQYGRHLMYKIPSTLSERIKRSRLDHRFQCTPINLFQIHPSAELCKTRERAAFRPFDNDGFHSASTDPFDRAESIQNGTVASDAELVRRSIDAGRL